MTISRNLFGPYGHFKQAGRSVILVTNNCEEIIRPRYVVYTDTRQIKFSRVQMKLLFWMTVQSQTEARMNKFPHACRIFSVKWESMRMMVKRSPRQNPSQWFWKPPSATPLVLNNHRKKRIFSDRLVPGLCIPTTPKRADWPSLRFPWPQCLRSASRPASQVGGALN